MQEHLKWLLKLPLISKLKDIVFEWLISKGLDKYLPFLRSEENLRIIQYYETRIEKLNKRYEKREEKSKKETGQILAALKRKALSTNKLVEKYNKPLKAILISYAAQKEEVRKGSYQKRSPFVRDELARYHSKYLGGDIALIPPTYVPHWIKDGKDLRRWFKRNILKKRYCKLKILTLIDLKKAYWENFLPYKQNKPIHKSIGEVLSVDDLFTEKQIKRISLGEIIIEGDIAWLASTILAGGELEKLLRNQALIEKKLEYPTLRKLADPSIKRKLSRTLSEFVDNPGKIADGIIKEAEFWNERLQS